MNRKAYQILVREMKRIAFLIAAMLVLTLGGGPLELKLSLRGRLEHRQLRMNYRVELKQGSLRIL